MNVMNMNERTLLVLIIVGSVVAAVVGVVSLSGRLDQLRAEELRAEEGLTLIREQLKSKASVPGKLIASTEVSTALDEISSAAAHNAVTFVSIAEPDEKVKSAYGKFRTAPADLETRSTYKQLGLFLRELNQLHRSVVLVDNLQVKDAGLPQGLVMSKIHLQIFLKDDHGPK